MYTPAQIRNWHRREPPRVPEHPGRITVVSNSHLHTEADTVQVRIARVEDLSRDDVLTIDLTPDDALELSLAIRGVTEIVRHNQRQRHPAES